MNNDINFLARGKEIRELSKNLVLEFMQNSIDCQPHKKGLKQSEIFKKCGFDFGDYPKVTSSYQQFWIAAILAELKKEKKVERISERGAAHDLQRHQRP